MYMVKGIITALITPFNEDLDLCTECLEEMLEFQVKNNVAGVFLSGTYGEGVITPLRVREKLITRAIEYAPSKTMLLPHIGGTDIEAIVKLAKLAKDLGYPAVSVVGPIYHSPTKKGLIRFYSYIASKADIPIVVYNNKGRQGYNITPEDYEVLAKEVPAIVGIKDTSYDVEQLLELVKKFSNKHFVASGGDNLIYYTFAIGAHAHICGISNAFPELAVGIYKAMSEGDYKRALELQYKVLLLRKAMKKYNVESQEVLRLILSLRGVRSGYSPLQLSYEYTEQQVKELKSLVEEFSKT